MSSEIHEAAEQVCALANRIVRNKKDCDELLAAVEALVNMKGISTVTVTFYRVPNTIEGL